MSSPNLRAPFGVKHALFQGFRYSPRETIPDHLKSPRASSERESVLGLGYINAAYLLLSGQVQVYGDLERTQICYTSTGASREPREASLVQDPGGTTLCGPALDSGTGAPLLALVRALQGDPSFAHTAVALRALLHLIGPWSGPVSDRLPGSRPEVRDALLSVADCAYFDLKELWDHADFAGSASLQGLRPVPLTTLLCPPPPEARYRTHRSLAARLGRLIARGGSGLLIGPPGTGKTESVKRAALAAGAALTLLKGAPGVEDRDFIGAIMPGEGGPKWQDGPLTRAISLGFTDKSVLGVDEGLRLEPAYINVLIGALDTLSRAELLALGVAPEAIGSHTGRFNALVLHSGEVVFCPSCNLTVLITTNWGEDHLQTASRIDGALLSRLDVVIEVDGIDPETLLELLLETSGGRRELVARVEQLLEHTAESMQNGGLYARSFDARKAIALLREACALLEEGLSEREAFLEAAELTALPHCCPRDPDGTLSVEAVRTLRDFLDTLS